MENKKYIIVTGACGGMGRKTVEVLAKSGYHIFSLDRIKKEEIKNVSQIVVDITNKDELENAYQEIIKETKDIYAIIHFAGIYLLNSLIEIEEAKFEEILKVNMYGPYIVNKTFVDLLHEGRKIIITTSELALLDPLPFTGLYAVTKNALDKYAYSLKMELQLLGINVSVIRPGAVDTKMLEVSCKELDNFVSSTTHYDFSAKKFKEIVDKVEAKSLDVVKIAKLVNKVLNKNKPKFSYNINRNKLLILLNILPKKLRFYIIKKILKNNK
ncbi:MAG: SDR family NAD(P)-dependent oxidoreductase [Bacilli bacterium]|nr:SDR family NAD(P)-dependent oxidoreductase [Bacilli bacterium]